MNTADIIPILLLLLLSLAVGTGVAIVLLVVRWARRNRLLPKPVTPDQGWGRFPYPPARTGYLRRPACWLTTMADP